MKPLYDFATKKHTGKKFVDAWTAEGMDAKYQKSKELLTMAVHLTHPDPSCPLALTTDASKSSCGAVLEQFEDGMWKPLGYWSKSLPPAKQKWSTFRRELVSIKDAIRHFIAEINGRHCIVFTDHKAIISAFKSNSMMHDTVAQNHIQEISLWTQDVRFLAGKCNNVADLLSRPSDVPLGSAYTLDGEDTVIDRQNAISAVDAVSRQLEAEIVMK